MPAPAAVGPPWWRWRAGLPGALSSLNVHACTPFINAILRETLPMNAAIGWSLVVLAVAAGYVRYGWRGVALASTVTAFWMLLQFSRALKVLRDAGRNPVGQVPNAVMFNARVRRGMRLPELLKLTQSLGRRLGSGDGDASGPETWAWGDDTGDEVHVYLQNGRVATWELKRAGA